MARRFALAALPLLLACASARVPTAPQSLSARHIWVEPLRTYDTPRVWFPDELEGVEDAVAAHFERRGYEVIAPAAVRRLRSNVVQGYLPGRPDVCPAPPPPAALTEVMWAGARRAELSVDCDDGPACRLIVTVTEPVPGERGASEDKERFELLLPPGSLPVTWAQMIDLGLLRAVPLPEGGAGGLGIGGMGGRAPGVYISLRNLRQSGPWAARLTTERLEPVKASLHACRTREGHWQDWWAVSHVIEVGSDGRLSRCVPSLPDHLPRPAFGCRCDVLRTVDFGRASPGRRARFTLDTQEVPYPNPRRRDGLYRGIYLVERQSEDPSAVLGGHTLDAAELWRCLEPLETSLGEHQIPVRFEVDRDGAVLSHRADWPEAVPAEVHRCVDARLPRARFTCPLQGEATVRAELKLSVITYEALRAKQKG